MLDSIAKSNLVSIAPLPVEIAISFKIPIILTLLPGVVLISIFGSTKSSFKKIVIRLGCSPPCKLSLASSIVKTCASTMSFAISLNPPRRPHEHRLGSLNFLSICKTEIIEPQLGHSNLALVTKGLTSLACRTIPSIPIIFPKCFERIYRIYISCPLEILMNRTRASLGAHSSSSRATSSNWTVSSGRSIKFPASSGECAENSSKLTRTTLFSPLIPLIISFLLTSKNSFASIKNSS